MPDTLSVELLIDDARGSVVIDRFQQKMQSAGTAIDSIAKKQIISEKSAQSFTLIEAKAEKLRRTLEAVSKNNLGKGFDSMAFLAEKASQKVGVIQNQLTGIRKLMSETSNKSVLDQLTSEAKTLESELDKVKSRADKLNQKQSGNSEESAGGKVNEGLSAIGLPEISAGAAVAGVAAFGKVSLDAAREADSAQRVLRASAKETGISYQKLTESAAEFGAITLQSNRAAQSSFAQIVTFANAAGRSDKLDEFKTKFADLAAAKGIDPSNLGEIAKQLNALTDEATDKLLNGNPSAFYDKFAKSINKTADSLTDAEKRAAVFDEVLRRGALFSGEAQNRLNSAASATDRLSVKFENFKEKAGAAVLPLAQFVEFAAKFATADASLYKSGAESAVGRSNSEILSKQRVNDTVQTLRQQDKIISDAISNPLASSLNYELSKINIADSFFNAENRQKLIDGAKTTAQKTADSFKTSFDAVLSDKNSSLALLKLGQKQFYANQADYDSPTRRQLASAFENSIAEKTKAEAEKAKTEADKRRADVEKATDKVKELQKQYLTTFDNLYSKANSSNPLVAVFTDANKALTELRKNLAGLSPELQAQAVALQTKINSNALFSAKLDNALSSFNLRDEANNFRNYKPKFDSSQADEIARRNVKYGNFFASGAFGTYGSNLANQAGGFDKLSDKQKRDIYEVSLLSQPSFTNQNPDAFTAGNQRSLISKLAGERLALANPNENLSFQEKLQKELDIVNKAKLGATTPGQVDAANRRIVALTSVDPSKLNDRERAQAAVAREAVAEQQDKFQQESLKVDKEKLKVEKELTNEIKKLREQAEKGGKAALDTLTVEIKDSPTTKSTVTRASPSDTAAAMDLGGGAFQLQLNQRPKQK